MAYARLMEVGSRSSPDALTGLDDLLARLDPAAPGGLRLIASTLVLRDLISLGWQTMASGGWLYVRPGAPGPLSKDSARRQLEFGRDDQLAEPSTRKFILALERPGRGSGTRPVTDLIADGRKLEADLRIAAEMEGTARDEALARACRPYLQPVTADARDDHTGLRLMDVWRYFRHTWATRYRSSPGRNLFYLIRDSARPGHPVMGITALGNAVMQLGPRDDAIGWTVDGLKRAIADGRVADGEVLAALRARIREDYSEIFLQDLPVPPELPDHVTRDMLDRLAVIDKQASDDRTDRLRDVDEDDAVTARVHDVVGVDLEQLARSPLFRAKRARTVRTLLGIHEAISATDSVASLFETEEGVRAINLALRQLKKRFSATSMMEITVCGAVPPYNHLLGGKLACLLMLSPRVRRDYAERYADTYSIIASQMAGRPVTKVPLLTFLGTSSLYPGRSSQYNRVRLPAGTCDGQEVGAEYEELGSSEGYGSPNLSAETEAALEALADRERSYRNVNFVFGEGQSPKLRQLREGFAALGLSRSNVLNHGTRRIVYGVDLAKNSTRLLLGVDREADFRVPDGPEAEERIVAFWRKRWLSSRLAHTPALASVGSSSPIRERVSRLIPERAASAQPDLLQLARRETRPMASVVEDEKLAFVRQLYRDESAYSDHVRIGRLRELNVRTRVDDVVRRIVRAGGSVVITGNAGDGKTHTIRLLESDLKAANARVIVDASAVSHEEIVAAWTEARDDKAPFCIAINEGPLIELIRQQSQRAPWLAEVNQQLLGMVAYVPVDQMVDERFTPQPGATIVIDLSLRRTLAPELVGRVIDKLTEDVWYENCEGCPQLASCPVHVNRTMLRTERVKARTVELLERVGERGLRATFREALGFVSYLIFGGKRCADLVAEGPSDSSHYSWLAFEGNGAIFEQIAGGLDPVRQTEPRVDEDLWRGRYEPEAFSGHELAPVPKRDLDDMRRHDEARATDAFTALKRRWYFEHPEGRLRYATQADRAFASFQDATLSSQLRAGRLIALINGWWNKADRNQQDHLRLWTRLAYSPRAQGRAMVSGRTVSNLRLTLLKPRLAPALRAAFENQAADHLLFAPPENVRFANLVVDRRLLLHLMSAGAADAADDLQRRLGRFNDSLAQHAEAGSHVRTIEMLDPESDLQVRVRVDLAQRRYDSAE
ncbi:Druantia anti-phage system protein DruA [Sphingomonas bacterium]|uniref:Druantia anti-phage system protein DruA n=1 Tax=Sphingomonas bacterium TaxID=1895847 RepID=UPI001575B225|nr:Druantia anti-phage system protein DruA [Sphingomonas bacterium]